MEVLLLNASFNIIDISLNGNSLQGAEEKKVLKDLGFILIIL